MNEPSARWDGQQWVSGDGLWAWNGSQWRPIETLPRRPGVALPAVYVVAGVLTLLLSLIALGFGGEAGPSMMDLAVLASWVGISVALVAGGFGFALGKRWAYWIGTIGVLVPSAVYPWSLFDMSNRLSSDSIVGIGPGSGAPKDAAAYYSAFLVSLVVALIAVGFRRSWVRWLVIPAIVFMALSCFELPAAVALVTAQVGGRKLGRPTGYFKGLLEAAEDVDLPYIGD